MLRILALFLLAFASCSVFQVLGFIPSNLLPTPIPIMPTETVIGTWEALISGVIYDDSTGIDAPIAGASVTYVVYSYFPELQAGRNNTAITDENGTFSIPVMVHDTDSIRLVIEAEGFVTHEEPLDAINQLGGGGSYLEIGLTPSLEATENPA